MEFRFNLNDIFKEPIVEIGNSLIPPGFSGDKRALWDTQSKITQIVNAIGEASATAQGLSKPITTADRLRNSEHKLYLLIDQSANNGKGAVTGMLKTGEKGLYVFDREGQHYQVSPPCVLDFYVHESRQRSGYGRVLFEHMLKKQQVEPVKMAIDRPSDKLLGFLNKHYGLHTPVKQMNNYVVYDGFFPKSSQNSRTLEGDRSHTPGRKQSANGLQQVTPSSPYGRYGAPRPPCSMGQIIHNDSAVIKRNQEPTGVRSEPFTNAQAQQDMTFSNQIPAWQTTQSLPNMHPIPTNPSVYPGNQPTYPHNPQFIQNQSHQYAQQQQMIPRQVMQYPTSAGDQTNVAVAQTNQIPHRNDLHYQTNLTMGQGDATNQHHMGESINHQGDAQNILNMSTPNQASASTNQAIQHTQVQPQFFTYQGQTYCYNPQTNQYQIILTQHPNVAPTEQQAVYENLPAQISAQRFIQPVQELQPVKVQTQKDPVRPQAFDGTVRKVQQTQSLPITQAKKIETPNVHATVQETASAPLNLNQQRNVLPPHGMNMLDQAYNSATEAPIVDQNQYEVNEVTTKTYSQPQTTLQNQYYLSADRQNSGQPSSPVHAESVQSGNNYNRIQVPSEHINANPNQDNLNLTSNILQPEAAVNQLTGPKSFDTDSIVNEKTFPSASVANQASPNNFNNMTNPSMQQQHYAKQHSHLRQEQLYQSSVPLHQNQMISSQNLGHPYSNLQQNLSNSNQNENMNNALEQPNVRKPETQQYMPNITIDNANPTNNAHVWNNIEADKSDRTAKNSTSKADRPQSLNIETALETLEQRNDDAQNVDDQEPLHGLRDHQEPDENDSLDGDPATLEAIEQEIEKVQIAPKEDTSVSRGSKSPGMEAAGIVTPGRNTPGLTDQGYFDLKFYHNKLW